jgi:hypothetical protein
MMYAVGFIGVYVYAWLTKDRLSYLLLLVKTGQCLPSLDVAVCLRCSRMGGSCVPRLGWTPSPR